MAGWQNNHLVPTSATLLPNASVHYLSQGWNPSNLVIVLSMLTTEARLSNPRWISFFQALFYSLLLSDILIILFRPLSAFWTFVYSPPRQLLLQNCHLLHTMMCFRQLAAPTASSLLKCPKEACDMLGSSIAVSVRKNWKVWCGMRILLCDLVARIMDFY